MNVRTDVLTANIKRICVTPPNSKIAFNHFLIVDKKPALIHMGQNSFFEHLLPEVAKHVEPADIRYLSFSHMEADECGALNQWMGVAPKAKVAIGKLCANSVRDFSLRPPMGLGNGERISLGEETLRIINTPHVPHGWDACLFYAEKSGVLFGSDLGTQSGTDHPLFREGDFTSEMLALIDAIGYMAYGPHMTKAIAAIRELPQVSVLAVMHGASLTQRQFHTFLDGLEARNALMMSSGH